MSTQPFEQLQEHSQSINEIKDLPELPKGITELDLSFCKKTYKTSVITLDEHLKEVVIVKGLTPYGAGVATAHYMNIILERVQNGTI